MKKKPLSHYLELMKSALNKQEYSKAKRYGEIALKKLSTLSYSPFEEYILCCRLGSAYFSLTERSRSLDVYYKAYLIASNQHLNPVDIAYASFGIGYNFLTMRNINQALLQFRKVEEYYQKYGNETFPMNKEIYFNTLIGFGFIYLYKNNFDQVKEIIDKKLPPYIPFMINKMFLSSYYKLQGEYFKAREEYGQSYQSFQAYIKIGEQINLPLIMIDGKAHLATIDLLEGKLDIAINKLEPLLKEAIQVKLNDLISTIGLLLSKCYKLKNMPNKANSTERKIKPILKKLDIIWFYEQSRYFNELYHRLQTVYKNTKFETKSIPDVLTNAIKQHYEISPYKNIIIGESLSMQEVYQLIEKVASTNLPILIQGKTGTGKELVARAIHHNSLRKEKPLLALNCGAMPETLLENELFGHTKGAFTDAKEDKKGYIELASDGTLFLDEIADMSPAMQQKLLRVLEEKLVWRLGAEKPIPVNTRFIFASNQNIEELVREKHLREDLLYRINTIVITLPFLRNRKEDIPLLVKHFLKKYFPSRHSDPAKAGEEPFPEISSSALALLVDYPWPGNVRELENEIKRIYALYPTLQSPVQRADAKLIIDSMLSESIRNYTSIIPQQPKDGLNIKDLKESFERNLIIETLQKYNGSIKQSAHYLGCTRLYLYRKINKLNISFK